MMGHRERMIDGDEFNALTRWKRIHNFPSKKRKKMKRKFNKRIRKAAKTNMPM